MADFFIVIPAYNEELNIETTISQWYPVVDSLNRQGTSSRLVAVNDGSKDQTLKILKKLQSVYPLLEVLDKSNGGHGSAVIAGYRYALAHDAKFIFQTDSDGQTNPEEFSSFWQQRHEYDAIFGNRTVRGDGKDRAFVEKVLCRILKFYFHVDIPDANAPFRLMTSDYLKQLLPILPSDDYNLPNAVLTALGVHYKKRVKFIPISFKPRQGGVNSINPKKITSIGMHALKDFSVIKERMKHEHNF